MCLHRRSQFGGGLPARVAETPLGGQQLRLREPLPGILGRLELGQVDPL